LRECKRIEEGYKKAIEEVQQNDEQYAAKIKDLEYQHAEKMKQMRLTLKYKDKS